MDVHGPGEGCVLRGLVCVVDSAPSIQPYRAVEDTLQKSIALVAGYLGGTWYIACTYTCSPSCQLDVDAKAAATLHLRQIMIYKQII